MRGIAEPRFAVFERNGLPVAVDPWDVAIVKSLGRQGVAIIGEGLPPEVCAIWTKNGRREEVEGDFEKVLEHLRRCG